MLKKILLILPLAMSFFFIAPKASYPESAYQVPWAEGKHYVIGDNGNNRLVAYVATSNTISTIILWDSFNAIDSNSSDNKWVRYYYSNNTWHKSYLVNNNNTTNFNVSGTPYVLNLNNVIASTLDIKNGPYGPIAFHKALFQLQLTPQQIRERATAETLENLTPHISTVLSVVLPLGLLVLSSLLVIHLIRRFLF